MAEDVGSFIEVLEWLANIIRRLGLAYFIVLACVVAILLVWRDPIFIVFRWATESLGTEVIAGTIMAPLKAFLIVGQLYAT